MSKAVEKKIDELSNKIHELQATVNKSVNIVGKRVMFKATHSDQGLEIQGGVDKEGVIASFSMVPAPTKTGGVHMQVVLLLFDDNGNMMTIPAEMCRPVQ